ncbi:MAG: hypothetical protein IJ011_03745 [Clostridia bacterium]|nr:hypothetical protein [Clostridia bacterium]
MDILKLCGVGLLCALTALIIKQIKGEYAALVRVGGTVIIFGALVLVAADIFSEIAAQFFGEELSGYGGIMLKALGLALLSKLCADICRDIGESSVGSGIELGGKLAILALCVPLIRELMGYAASLLGMGEI